MAVNKMLVMLPLMYAARKLDNTDVVLIQKIRMAYFSIQFCVVLAVLYIYMKCNNISKTKPDHVIYVPAEAKSPFAAAAAAAADADKENKEKKKKQYKETTFHKHLMNTARSLLTSTLMGIMFTCGLHFYKKVLAGIAIQSIMGPLNLFENALAKVFLLKGGDVSSKDRIFSEKTKDELTKDDEVVDDEGKVKVITHTTASKPEKPVKKTFEDVLLDAWDAYSNADLTELLKMLSSSNVNFQTKESGWTPLMIIAALPLSKEQTTAGLKKVLELGANPTTLDGEGWNALHWAAFHNSVNAVPILLEKEPSLIDVKDTNEGKTPLDVAKAEKNDEVVTLLEKYMGKTVAVDDVNDENDVGGGLADQEGMRKRK